MTTFAPPPQTRTIGRVTFNGKAVPVEIDYAWFVYLNQSLYQRVGGALGESNAELSARVDSVEDAIAALPPPTGTDAVAVAVNFGATFTDKAQAVVTGQSWVTTGSEIVAQVLTPSGTDPDEMRLLDMSVVISDIVPGVGFTVTVYSEPEAKGSYTVACLGV